MFMSTEIVEIDGIKLDPENKLFFQAAELVRMSRQNIIYLTGKAGTGKTTFLKYVMQTYQGAIVLAPTGVAAVNAHGQTIHSFFHLELTPYPPGDQRLAKPQIYDKMRYKHEKIELIENLSLIIIDEVSMIRCDMLDTIDIILRTYRKSNEPFGGIKMLLVGDLFQLPPIAKPQDYATLRKYYKSMYFFDSFVYQRAKTTFIELEKPYRQTEAEFIDILNKVRINQLSNFDLITLNKRMFSLASAPEGSIYLAPLNYIVDNYNDRIYNNIAEEEVTFYSDTDGTFPDSMKPVPDKISLKVGAQVMVMKNKYDNVTNTFEYFNGSIGEILEIDEPNCVTVKLSDNNEVNVYPATWENVEFIWNAKTKKSITRVIGKYTQIPLKLAWAITIHKSQGLTFDNVIADLNSCFDTGQVYVALSRCRKLSGLFLKTPLNRNVIKVDQTVVNFSQLKTPQTMIVEQIKTGKADALYKDCRQAFENNDTEKMLKCYKDAIKIRDDFETPEFRKFIKVKIDLFYHYKETCRKLWRELEKKDMDLAEAQEKIEYIQTNYTIAKRNAKKLQTDKNTTRRTLQEVKKQYKNLQEELDLSKKETASQKEKYSFMENTLKEQLDAAREENAVLGEKLALIQEELNNANNEIKRLQNLSLWDRIRGKK